MLTPATPEVPWSGRPPAASSTRHADRIARAWSTLILLAGMLDLVSTLLPAGRARLALLAALVPWSVTSGATVLLAAVGLGLVLLAGGLRRHRRSAYLATVVLLASSAVLHVAKSLDVGAAVVEAFLAGILVSRSEPFTARLGPDERPSALRTALAVPPVTLAYGVAGLLVNRGDVAADRGHDCSWRRLPAWPSGSARRSRSRAASGGRSQARSRPCWPPAWCSWSSDCSRRPRCAAPPSRRSAGWSPRPRIRSPTSPSATTGRWCGEARHWCPTAASARWRWPAGTRWGRWRTGRRLVAGLAAYLSVRFLTRYFQTAS